MTPQSLFKAVKEQHGLADSATLEDQDYCWATVNGDQKSSRAFLAASWPLMVLDAAALTRSPTLPPGEDAETLEHRPKTTHVKPFTLSPHVRQSHSGMTFPLRLVARASNPKIGFRP